MPLDQHLVVHIQEMVATEQGFCDYLLGWTDQVSNVQLKDAITHEIDDIQTQVANLRECLTALGAEPVQGLTSPFVMALQREDELTMQEMPKADTWDMDIHLALSDITFGHLEVGMYQGMIAMAQALGKDDVVDILKTNLRCEHDDLRQIQNLLPTLTSASSSGGASWAA
jgi:ferritin-like metal-binding protein YciE